MLPPAFGSPELGAGAGNSERCCPGTPGATPVRFDSFAVRAEGTRGGRGPRAARPAIGPAVTHVAQRGAIIGRTDCLKKRGPGPRERPQLFRFSLSAELTAHTSTRGWQSSPKLGAHENLRVSIHL